MIKITTVLICNTCKSIASEQPSRKIAMVEWVRMIANENGWITTTKNGIERHFCPDCQVASALNASITPPNGHGGAL